jgi:hypothetical protein
MLDAGAVDVPMVYTLAFALLSSLKLLLFKSLKKGVALLGQRGSIRPRHPLRARHEPLRGLLVPVATILDLRHTARH